MLCLAFPQKMVAFAGYPLLVGDKLVGVVALFARHELTDETLRATGAIASSLAQTIERARAQERVRASEAWLSTTLTSIGDGVITADPQGRVTFLNPVAAALTGWGADEARGKPLDDVFKIIGETTRAPVESPVAKVLREGGIVGLANHTLLVRRDGTETSISDSAAPIRHGDGALLGVVLVFRDASGKREAERERAAVIERERLARAQSEAERARLHQFLMQAPAIICVLKGPNHVFELTNPRYLQIVGGREMLGKTVRDGAQRLSDLLAARVGRVGRVGRVAGIAGVGLNASIRRLAASVRLERDDDARRRPKHLGGLVDAGELDVDVDRGLGLPRTADLDALAEGRRDDAGGAVGRARNTHDAM